MFKLIQLHIRFADISGQLSQTEEFALLTALAKVLRPAVDARTIGFTYWVTNSARERTLLIIQPFTSDLYPANEMIEIPLKDIPKAVLEEFDRQWEKISRKPWIPPRKLSVRSGRNRIGNVIEFPRRSR